MIRMLDSSGSSSNFDNKNIYDKMEGYSLVLGDEGGQIELDLQKVVFYCYFIEDRISYWPYILLLAVLVVGSICYSCKNVSKENKIGQGSLDEEKEEMRIQSLSGVYVQVEKSAS